MTSVIHISNGKQGLEKREVTLFLPLETGYKIFAGKIGDNLGRFVGTADTLRSARGKATKARNEYHELSWSQVVCNFTGWEERREGTAHSSQIVKQFGFSKLEQKEEEE